ncbi:MAG: lysoplasmalogenase family protein [Bacilli bacterium]
MPNLTLAVLIVETLFMLVYLLFYYRLGSKIILFLKMVTSFGFVLIGFINLKEAEIPQIANTVLLGLVLGFLGDFVLGLRRVYRNRKKEFFYGGLLLFFLGHVIYMIAFFQLKSGSLLMSILLALVLLLLVYTVSVKNNIDYQQAKIPVIVYMAASTFLLALVFTSLISQYSLLKLVIFVGAFSFVFSDFFLSFLYFKKMERSNIRFLKALNIITYYLGQTLFALSILLM